jgi:hypothetical protein
VTEAANTSASQGDNQQQSAPAAGSNGASDQQSQAPVRPTELSDKSFDAYFDPQKGVKYDVLAKDFSDLRAHKAADDLRRAAVPAKADEYKLALPQTFELPKGKDGKPVAYQFDEKDPRLAPARAFAHKVGLDQAGFSELLSIHAQYEIGEAQMIQSAKDAEIAKLGANGPARVDAVSRFMHARLGTDRGQALMDRMVLAGDIEALEDLVKLYSTQGGAGMDQRHRETPSKELSEEAYSAMPLSERLAHTRKAEAARRTH